MPRRNITGAEVFMLWAIAVVGIITVLVMLPKYAAMLGGN